MRSMLTLVLVLSTSLTAMFMRIDINNVPVDRLAANLTRQMTEKPDDLEIRVNLARVYAMAYAQKVDQVPAMELRGGALYPRIGTDGMPHEQFEVKPPKDEKVRAAAQENLTRAIATYRSVLERDPAHSVALLGLGWSLLQAGNRTEALVVLRKAADAAWVFESGPKGSIYAGGHGVTEEAARYLIPLLDPQRDAEEIARLRDRIKKLESVARWITPIVIPMRDHLTALDMVDDEADVAFDLDGRGKRRWTWITSDAAWLVTDHRGTGDITSGLQLFGNVTFWAFWQNGYHALRALDDNGDGRLRGPELAGLALWHDRNRDAISDRGEVRPLADWGIVELSTEYRYDASHPHEIPWSRAGVRFSGGTVRPTFDVVFRRH